MYSGTTLNQKSGNLIGVHQKIDRQARLKLKEYTDDDYFPAIARILHFEGKHGPDGIKRKAPSRDELWHFIDPTDPGDTTLLSVMRDHHTNLVEALKSRDEERAAFEAAWLAHAVVDGLTPAHHYPLEGKLEAALGDGIHTRTSLKKKILLPGATTRLRVRNNWEFWGAKGVLTSHYLFEFGVASAVTPLRRVKVAINKSDTERLKKDGFEPIFRDYLDEIHELHMFENFCRTGWNAKLARQTRAQLIPLITKTVMLAWLNAVYNSRR